MIEVGLDGILALALLFPAMFFGIRFARAGKPKLGPSSILAALAACIGFFLSMFLADIRLFGLSLLAVFVLACVIHVMRRGSGNRRFIACAMLAFAGFSFASYFASGVMVESGERPRELAAIHQLREISIAENLYLEDHARTATTDELRAAGLLSESPSEAYTIVVRPGPLEMQKTNQFYAVATPSHYRSRRELPEWLALVPGISLVKERLINGPSHMPWAARSFAIDETDVIREADLGGRTDVRRADAEKWPQR